MKAELSTDYEGNQQSGRRLALDEIGACVCDVASKQLGIHREKVHLGQRLIEDLHCDSLALVELLMGIEDAFDVALPDKPTDPTYKSVFVRSPFRLSDLAELVYLQQGSGRMKCRGVVRSPIPARRVVAFTQLGGSIATKQSDDRPLYEKIGSNAQGYQIYRRRTDGMVCVLLPAADVTIGSGWTDSPADEQPAHQVRLESFLIDAEPVSTTAYCRFLNSVDMTDPPVLREWFKLPPEDKRQEHELIRRSADQQWRPLPRTERFPMILVSWYGANAYSLWANQKDWRQYRDTGPDASCLPSEEEWEYAARGKEPTTFPWGDEPATPERMRFGSHQPGAKYLPETLPLAEVNEDLGLSPFGLRHMAGNVWQWSRSWYLPQSYRIVTSAGIETINCQPPTVKSERGGSWIGSAFLCRSSYRRGRVPHAKGRCLGFRCVGDAETYTINSANRTGFAWGVPPFR